MIRVRCSDCNGQFPLNETFKIWERELCKTCAQKLLQSDAYISAEAVQFQMDPSVCRNCGRDNGATPLERLAGFPTCGQCIHFFRHRPFPIWVKTAAAGVLVLVAFSFYFNARFFLAYREMKLAFRSEDFRRAADLFESASNRVPETEWLQDVAACHRGIQLVNDDKPAEALPYLRQSRSQSMVFAASQIDDLILGATADKCFDEADYDGFLKAAADLVKRHPTEPTPLARLASANACKYAETGEADFKREALQSLKRLKQAAGGDPTFDGFEDRMLHRLDSGEIIGRQEYHQRYPDGWHGNQEQDQ